MKNIGCLLGIHDYERLSKPVPTKENDEFNLLVNSYALGKCRRCSKFSMVRCWSGLDPYFDYEVKTKGEWLVVLAHKYFRLGGE